MSVKIMTLVWERAPYTSGSLLVLLALADWANDEGVCWPAVGRLAKKARLERRSTQYIIRQLKADEMLQIDEGGGRGKRHKYFINVHKLRLLPEIKDEIDDTETVQFGAERVQFTTEKVQPIAPDPLVEPSVDPPVEPSEARARSKSVASLTDEEFLARLQANPTYSSINVRQLNERMKVWCEVNGKRPTRRRLVNWLNREDRPMENGNGSNKPRNESSTERNVRNLRENAEYIRRLQDSDRETDREDPIGLLAANL